MTREKAIRKHLIFGLLLCVFTFAGCNYFRMDFTDDKLKVINNSDLNIHLFVNYNYPDTSFFNSSANSYLPAKDSGSVSLVNQNWDSFMDMSKYITIFIANDDSIRKYSQNWREKVTPLKKTIVQKSGLDSSNWTIYYP